MTWLYYTAGIAFCGAGLYLFFKNLFEKDRTILPSVLVILMGVILILYGAAYSLK